MVVTGDEIHRPLEALEAAGQLRNPAESVHRMVTGVKTELNPNFFGHGKYLLQEVLVVLPHLGLGVFPTVGQPAVEFRVVERGHLGTAPYRL